MRILLVEDDRLLGDGIRAGLQQAGFAVDWAQDGRAAELALASEAYDAVVLDLGLPRLSGMEVLARARAARNAAPVLILTARDTVPERIAGLDAGADDYLVKPFDLGELQARLRALIRRGRSLAEPLLAHGALRLDPAARSVSWEGRPVELSAREFAVLHALLLNAGRLLSKAQIEEKLYGWGEEIESNAVEVFVHHLRRKLSSDLRHDADRNFRNRLRSNIKSQRSIDAFQCFARDAFAEQVIHDQLDLATTSNHTDVAGAGARQVIQRLFIMIMTARHDDAVGAGIDLQTAQSRFKRINNQPLCPRKTLGVAIFLAIIDDPDIESDIGRQFSHSLADVTGPDNDQAASFQVRQVRDAADDIRPGSIVERLQIREHVRRRNSGLPRASHRQDVSGFIQQPAITVEGPVHLSRINHYGLGRTATR